LAAVVQRRNFPGHSSLATIGRRSARVDLPFDVQIKLEEAAFGAKKRLKSRNSHTCGKCRGSGAKPGSYDYMLYM
jgi:molecular chaperone DnaJ